MKKNIVFILLLCMTFVEGMAQANPKWAEKVGHAVFSIITYDSNDKILNNGNGFFISEDGIAVSDYTTFKGAQRAVVIMDNGKQLPVTSIIGANDIYDVIKFRVALPKHVTALTIAQNIPAIGSDIYLIPYSTQKSRICTVGKIKEITKIESKYNYYKYSLSLKDKMVSCPITDDKGDVIALVQKSVSNDAATTCYGLDIAFANSLTVGLNMNSDALKSIGIKKDLPDDENQALVYTYMSAGSLNAEQYAQMLNDFIEKFPHNSDGYIRRATNYINIDKDGMNIELANKDLDEAVNVAKTRDDALYNRSKLVYDYLQIVHQNPYKEWTLDKAYADIKEAYSIHPLPLYALLEAKILFSQKKYEMALADFNKVNQTNLASPATYYGTAISMQMAKYDTKQVLAMMDSCIAHCPSPITRDVAVYVLARAQMRVDAKMYRQAWIDYNTYYDSMNGNVNDSFYYYREQAALYAHQYQSCLDDIQKAIDMSPKNMLYLLEQAALNLRLGRIDMAVVQLQNAMKIDPKNGEVYRLLGICQVKQKKNQEACANFNKSKELGNPGAQEMIDKYCK